MARTNFGVKVKEERRGESVEIWKNEEDDPGNDRSVLCLVW